MSSRRNPAKRRGTSDSQEPKKRSRQEEETQILDLNQEGSNEGNVEKPPEIIHFDSVFEKIDFSQTASQNNSDLQNALLTALHSQHLEFLQ